MRQTIPTFLGIGAPRTGTTWIHDRLAEHPQAWVPPIKELHFFDRSPNYISPNDLYTKSLLKRIVGMKSWQAPRTISQTKKVVRYFLRREFDISEWWAKFTFGYYDEDWYCNLFSQGKDCKARGEITPAYSILNGEDIARIKAINPEIKLLFMIRNPIERVWSSVRYNVNKSTLDVDINSPESVVASLKELQASIEPDRVARGDYERTLENYTKYFDSSQILVCFYDAISRDPEGLLFDVTKFLGIDVLEDAATRGQIRSNSSPALQMPQEVKDYLLETHASKIQRLAAIFGGYATTWEMDSANGQEFPPTMHL